MTVHASYRAIIELFRDLFDWRISLGMVQHIVRSEVEPAKPFAWKFTRQDMLNWIKRASPHFRAAPAAKDEGTG
jgi:hypothetical protein